MDQKTTIEESGLLNINKKSGVTSFSVVHDIKRSLKIKKVGHCGTLDPLAEGVLLILFGSATKLQPLLMASEKTYRAVILLGKKTDSGDITGKVVEEKAVPKLDKEYLDKILGQFVGEIIQVPPMYSALKIDGKRLYEYARTGETVERNSRKISIYSIELLSFNSDHLEIRVKCSKGTYIRVLAEDIGAKIGCCATIKALVREEVGPFNISDSLNSEILKEMPGNDLLSKAASIEQLRSIFNQK